jgi:hypothetical protein
MILYNKIKLKHWWKIGLWSYSRNDVCLLTFKVKEVGPNKIEVL